MRLFLNLLAAALAAMFVSTPALSSDFVQVIDGTDRENIRKSLPTMPCHVMPWKVYGAGVNRQVAYQPLVFGSIDPTRIEYYEYKHYMAGTKIRGIEYQSYTPRGKAYFVPVQNLLADGTSDGQIHSWVLFRPFLRKIKLKETNVVNNNVSSTWQHADYDKFVDLAGRRVPHYSAPLVTNVDANRNQAPYVKELRTNIRSRGRSYDKIEYYAEEMCEPTMVIDPQQASFSCDGSLPSRASQVDLNNPQQVACLAEPFLNGALYNVVAQRLDNAAQLLTTVRNGLPVIGSGYGFAECEDSTFECYSTLGVNLAGDIGSLLIPLSKVARAGLLSRVVPKMSTTGKKLLVASTAGHASLAVEDLVNDQNGYRAMEHIVGGAFNLIELHSLNGILSYRQVKVDLPPKDFCAKEAAVEALSRNPDTCTLNAILIDRNTPINYDPEIKGDFFASGAREGDVFEHATDSDKLVKMQYSGDDPSAGSLYRHEHADLINYDRQQRKAHIYNSIGTEVHGLKVAETEFFHGYSVQAKVTPSISLAEVPEPHATRIKAFLNGPLTEARRKALAANCNAPRISSTHADELAHMREPDFNDGNIRIKVPADAIDDEGYLINPAVLENTTIADAILVDW